MSMTKWSAVSKWRQNHPERFAEQNRKYSSANYHYRKELKRFYRIDVTLFD